MLLIIWLLISTGCRTIPKNESISIPPFFVSAPTRPLLKTIPLEKNEALKSLTNNLILMDGYIKQLELYISQRQVYYDKIISLFDN
jgi:hypothetical protein